MADATWALLALSAVLAGHLLTGDFLPTIHTREAWARAAAPPWDVVLNPQPLIGYITGVEPMVTVLFMGATLWALRRQPAYGLYALLLGLRHLFSGQLLSAALLPGGVSVLMPAAQAGRRPAVDTAITVAGAMLQAFYFYAWCQLFWVA